MLVDDVGAQGPSKVGGGVPAERGNRANHWLSGCTSVAVSVAG